MLIKYKPLYKLDSKGNVRIWYMEKDGGLYRTTSGIFHGNLVTSNWTECFTTNRSKSNERGPLDQAVFEITSKYTEQKNDGYHDDITLVQSGDNTKKYFEPMLAQKYETYMGECYSQPKLDGIRCLAMKTGLWSRTGKKIVSCPHIERSLSLLFNKATNLILDGELYNHELKDDFNKITSLVKKLKPTKEDLLESENIVQYHMYDSPSIKGPFNKRLSAFKTFSETDYPGIKLVSTSFCKTEIEVDNEFNHYLDLGYEGQIIRLSTNEYEEGKRSKQLLKRKLLYEGKGNEEEFRIVNILSGLGNWSGKAKAVVLAPKSTHEFFKDGSATFKATLKGNMKYCEEIYNDRTNYVGKLATVTYQNLTPDGKPRFGIIKELDRWDI